MKKVTTLLMALMLMSTALWAQETVTVSANSSDISEGLDLKVVAKLFAEAKNLEEFENMLNNPDSAFCNLDLNGDGEVDYLRVVETGEGNKRLIVLQAILAKDIYQDVASIYVEKDEKNEVSVQVVGDEYVYGQNYIIEPVYVYRPYIYDWFWGPRWHAWHSPWYWGYYPGWWYHHHCWARDWYWHRCYTYHHHHHWCSFRPGHGTRHGYHDLHSGVTRRDYATAHPDRSFHQRNTGMTNARDLRHNSDVHRRGEGGRQHGPEAAHRSTFDSRNTAAQRTEHRSGEATHQRTDRRPSEATTQRTEHRSTESAQRTDRRPSEATTQRTDRRSTESGTRTTYTERPSRSSGSSSSAQTSSSSSSTRSSGSSTRSSSSGSRSSSNYSGGSHSSSRSSGSYSGGSHSGSSSRGGSYSGGSHSGSSSRGGSYSGGGHSGGGSRGGSRR